MRPLKAGDNTEPGLQRRPVSWARKVSHLGVVRLRGSGRGVLDQGEDPSGHEAGRSNRRAAAGDLGDLDDPTTLRHFDPSPGTGSFDLIGSGRSTSVDDDLDTITLHGASPFAERWTVRRRVGVEVPIARHLIQPEIGSWSSHPGR
jgi:hypothetical protein